jgi:hypothetical protein
VPGTDLAAYLLASDLVPGTDLAAWLAFDLVPGTDLAACLLASIRSGRRPKLRWICCSG